MRRIVIIGFSLVGLLLVGYLLRSAGNRFYLNERRELLAQIKTASARLADYQKARVDQKRVSKSIHAYVDRTLGGDLEMVDHKLRSRLSRLAEQTGLQNISVGPFRGDREKDSPAKAEFSRAGFQRVLREEIDFVELEGWVTGTGTLEQSLKLIEAIDAEHWLKRIDQLTLNPSDNGAKFQVKILLTSLFLPNRSPDPNANTPPVATNGERYATLLKTNLFRLPPPAPPPPVLSEPAAPERFAFGQWLLTGIAQSAAGPEIWLLNQQTRETKYLNVGQRIDEMTLVGANAETAVFLVGADRFAIAVGKNLNDRTALNQ